MDLFRPLKSVPGRRASIRLPFGAATSAELRNFDCLWKEGIAVDMCNGLHTRGVWARLLGTQHVTENVLAPQLCPQRSPQLSFVLSPSSAHYSGPSATFSLASSQHLAAP